MKNLLFRFLVCVLLFSITGPQVFAGIPIVDNDTEVQQVNKKTNKRISKLKKKITTKIWKQDVEDGENKVAAIVFAILIPFVGVAIYQDRVGRDFWITLILTALLYIPGLIYALTIVLR